MQVQTSASNTKFWSSAGPKERAFSIKQNCGGIWQAETGQHWLSWAAQYNTWLLIELKGVAFSFFLFSDHLLCEAG